MSSQSQKSQALLSLWGHLVLTSIAKHTRAHAHAHALALALALTLSHSHTLSHTLSHSLTLSHTLSLSHSLTHTHTWFECDQAGSIGARPFWKDHYLEHTEFLIGSQSRINSPNQQWVKSGNKPQWHDDTPGMEINFFVHRPLWLVDFKIYQPLNVFTSHFLVFNRQCVTACEN